MQSTKVRTSSFSDSDGSLDIQEEELEEYDFDTDDLYEDFREESSSPLSSFALNKRPKRSFKAVVWLIRAANSLSRKVSGNTEMQRSEDATGSQNDMFFEDAVSSCSESDGYFTKSSSSTIRNSQNCTIPSDSCEENSIRSEVQVIIDKSSLDKSSLASASPNSPGAASLDSQYVFDNPAIPEIIYSRSSSYEENNHTLNCATTTSFKSTVSCPEKMPKSADEAAQSTSEDKTEKKKRRESHKRRGKTRDPSEYSGELRRVKTERTIRSHRDEGEYKSRRQGSLKEPHGHHSERPKSPIHTLTDDIDKTHRVKEKRRRHAPQRIDSSGTLSDHRQRNDSSGSTREHKEISRDDSSGSIGGEKSSARRSARQKHITRQYNTDQQQRQQKVADIVFKESLLVLAKDKGIYTNINNEREKSENRRKERRRSRKDQNGDDSIRKYDSRSERHLRRERRSLKHTKWDMEGACDNRARSMALALKGDTRQSGVLGILLDYLDNNITLISRMQDKSTLSNIIVNVWGKICTKLKDVVETKPELQEEHYNRVGDSLKYLKHHFQNSLGEHGISEENLTARPEFHEVIDSMDLQKMNTEDLIVQHYKEQSEERGERSTGAGVIDLKLSLKERRDGKAILFAKLLGARELIALDTNGKSDPFIQLQVVPSHLFPDCELKQSTIKKSTLEPIYNEMFEFIIPQDQIENGVLVLSVFDYDFISANDFEGEAMVRLTDLPRNSEQHVKWTMALHRPMKDSIYKIVEGRVNDKVAMKFVEVRKKAMEAEDFQLEKEERGRAES